MLRCGLSNSATTLRTRSRNSGVPETMSALERGSADRLAPGGAMESALITPSISDALPLRSGMVSMALRDGVSSRSTSCTMR